MSERHIGQQWACCSSCATQDGQKRWCPHGTKANLASRRCTRHTSHKSCDWGELLIVVVAVVAHFVVVLCVRVTCSIVGNSVCDHTVTHGAQELHACVSAVVEPGNARFDACFVEQVGALLGPPDWHTAVQSPAGPSLWNSLPDSLRDPDLGRDSFRRLLKTHLFSLYWSKHLAY